MDFAANTVLKENYTFLVADGSGMIQDGERGLYNRDTRFLSRYSWDFSPGVQLLTAHTPRPDRYAAHLAVLRGPSQAIGIRRNLKLAAALMTDVLELENTGREPASLRINLAFGSDFADVFEVRGAPALQHEVRARILDDAATVLLEHVASDGLEQSVVLRFSPPPSELTPESATFTLKLEPGASAAVRVSAELLDPQESALNGPDYDRWRQGFPAGPADSRQRSVFERAVEDLRALLLFTGEGPIPAAGIPWFVTTFGRDSLLTSFLLLPQHPAVALGTLRHLASAQGRIFDPARSEAPGKILHELRQGELARTGVIPFGRYYGTIDATPLFLMLLHRTWHVTGDDDLVRELRPAWEAALRWMETDGDPDGDGFLEFAGDSGGGLSVQTWKDSSDALSHADGRLATGAIAASEVQGYAYAAWLAAADFRELLGEPGAAAACRERAAELKRRFNEAFWLEGPGTYALALDGDKTPLEVLASNAGHLLWTGIVPPERAGRVVAALFSSELWSGWGVRTLGTGEARYNPVSYHNGSVWPHDNAIIAAGLRARGFVNEADRIDAALLDLAASQADLRAPELIGGYERDAGPPVPYPVACRPQAWAAAALVAAVRGLGRES